MVVTIPLQSRIWPLLTSDRFVTWPWMLGLCLGSTVVVAVTAYLAPVTLERLSASIGRRLPGRRLTIWLFVGFAVLAPWLIAVLVLQRFPNSGDEFAYLFQARLFAGGHLWAQVPPLADTFVPYRTWIIGDKWLSQYPPGWPLALAAAIAVGIPAWSANALLSGGVAATLLWRGWAVPSRQALLIVAALGMLTPFFLLNAASFFSHMVTALLVMALCQVCRWYQQEQRIIGLIVGGMLLGLIGLTRYFSLILLLPALGYWLLVENRHARVRIVVVMALAGLPFLGLLMAYQSAITGSPLRSTYALITATDVSVSLRPADVLEGVRLTVIRFWELNIWATPLLAPAYLWCLASKVKHRSIAFYDLIFPAFVAGYVLFADSGGNRYGPRYYFDAFPAMLLTIVSAGPQAADWSIRLFRRRLAMPVALAGAVCLLTALPFAIRAYHRQVESRREPYLLAAAQGLRNAVVILQTSSGRGIDMEDLARNDEALQSSVLYARGGVTPEELRRVFPQRSVWVYRREDFLQPGRLDSVPPREPQ